MLDNDVAIEVLTLDAPRAVDPAVVGAKAAALARARRAGLPVLDGFVVTGIPATLDDATLSGAPAGSIPGSRSEAIPGSLRTAWAALTDDGRRALVVRSSSVLEDAPTSSMAGQFTTVVGVRGWDEFVDALGRVARSARAVASSGSRSGAACGPGSAAGPEPAPLAVLVQPLVVPRVGGVVFGVDPVTGRSDRRMIAAVAGLPEQLVSGTASGSRFEVDASGAAFAERHAGAPVRVSKRDRRRIAALEARCAEIFGGPQDVEWGIDDARRLWLFQSRPVTTTIAGIPQGPVLGPGPVAETFPDPLDRLEQDLWADPLRRAIGTVLDVLGATSPRARRASPLLVVVDGRVAVDLELFEPGHRSAWYAIAHRARAIRAAWRIGRLRAALVGLGHEALVHADRALLDVPALHELSDRQLVAALERFRDALYALHCHEMLVGIVLRPGDARLTASSIALRVLAQGRADGIADDDLPLHQPIVLVLTPPRIGPTVAMPRHVAVPEWSPGDEDPAATTREALRVRIRWVQEAGARFAWELGRRLAAAGTLATPEAVRHLDVESLEMTVRGLATPVPHPPAPRADSRPLPARFRLSDVGVPVPELDRHPHQGSGAGGGRGRGPVHLGPTASTGTTGTTAPGAADRADAVPDGAVLVVETLDPRLAPALARCRGLVAETGSVLAHLAILAREAGVPTVVGLEGATRRFAEGEVVEVDGVSGAVRSLDRPRPASDPSTGAVTGARS